MERKNVWKSLLKVFSFFSFHSFLHPEERATLSQLIQGYDSMDAYKIVAAYDNPFIRNLDNEYSKLARSLQELQKEKIKKLKDSSLTEEERNREMEKGILL